MTLPDRAPVLGLENSKYLLEFCSMTSPQFEQCACLRNQVFVDEQGFSESIEVDSLDQEATHVLLYSALPDKKPIGVARFFPSAPYTPDPCTPDLPRTKEEVVYVIGRVAILKDYRNLGLGRLIMNGIIEEGKRRGIHRLVIHSQWDKVEFYHKCGFVTCQIVKKEGNVEEWKFVEEGVDHVGMELIY